MLVFWDERLVFLATPKTASTAIEVALESLAALAVQRPAALKHVPARDVRRFLLPWLETAAGGPFTTVALIREPVAWLGSWFRFGQREDEAETAASTVGLSFEDFARAWLAGARPEVGSQAAFLAGAGGERGVDRLFRYEAIAGFVHFLEERLGCEILLPKLKVSPAVALDLAAATRERLAAALAADYRLYAGAETGPA
ncbi:MAG: hypothetical protein IT545_12265 [Rhodobacteraceae bacterium]|nr:hypothetical protein [Paracoccaceae bacterium]